MSVIQSLALFALAAVAEIGGAYLVWLGLREGRGWRWVAAGGIALALYGVIATLRTEQSFGRIFAAYGGLYIAGSIAWAAIFEGFRPDRWDRLGAATACPWSSAARANSAPMPRLAPVMNHTGGRASSAVVTMDSSGFGRGESGRDPGPDRTVIGR